MINIRKRRGDFIKTAINKSLIPRNQIAAISGLTNTYILDLMKGNIANANRHKLIAFAISVNLSLPEIDEMLTIFDRANLNRDDIPTLLDTAKRSKISTTLHPLREELSYEFMVLATELLPGPTVLNLNYPTAALRIEGHRTYIEKDLGEGHSLYSEIREAVGRERKNNLSNHLSRHKIEHFIYHGDLEKYIVDCLDKKEKEFRIKHVEQVIWYLNKFPNFNIYITNTYHAFSFLLKIGTESKEKKECILFTGREYDPAVGKMAGRLAAFGTCNQVIVKNFIMDVEHLKKNILTNKHDRKKIILYFKDLIHKGK
jgi:hypothetical protein